jgi:hypothetical protein
MSGEVGQPTVDGFDGLINWPRLDEWIVAPGAPVDQGARFA